MSQVKMLMPISGFGVAAVDHNEDCVRLGTSRDKSCFDLHYPFASMRVKFFDDRVLRKKIAGTRIFT